MSTIPLFQITCTKGNTGTNRILFSIQLLEHNILLGKQVLGYSNIQASPPLLERMNEMTFSGNSENTPECQVNQCWNKNKYTPYKWDKSYQVCAVRENYVCLGPAPQGVKIDSLWLMTRHLNAKSSVPCVHGIDCIKITFPSCLSMDMVHTWSVASEDSGTELEPVALNKRQTNSKCQAARNRQHWKIKWEWCMEGLASPLL